MGALARATLDPDYPAEIAVVVCNRPHAEGLKLAREMDVPFVVIDHKEFASREEHEEAVSEALAEARVELVCLAGYMRIMSEVFTNRWRGKIVNIHPSLLPAFTGIQTHERALDRGVRIHGCTVHFVNKQLDGGPIIMQGAVPVLINDTPETLGNRVLELEHDLYPRAIAMIATSRIRWSGDERVLHNGAQDDDVSTLKAHSED